MKFNFFNFSPSLLETASELCVHLVVMRKDYFIRNDLCFVVYDSCAQWCAHKYEQFLHLHVRVY